jgi:hypothetical protein
VHPLLDGHPDDDRVVIWHGDVGCPRVPLGTCSSTCTSDGVCVIVYVKFLSLGAGTVWGSSLHSGIEFGRSRTSEGSSGGSKRGMV